MDLQPPNKSIGLKSICFLFQKIAPGILSSRVAPGWAMLTKQKHIFLDHHENKYLILINFKKGNQF